MPLQDRLFILVVRNGKRVAIPAVTIVQWAKWFEDAANQKLTTVKREMVGDVMVSTVFLSVNRNYSPKGPPILYETMVFGGPLDRQAFHCSTWEQAEAQHLAIMKLVKRKQGGA